MTFVYWAKSTEFSSVIAKFDDIAIEIPINLYKIELI